MDVRRVCVLIRAIRPGAMAHEMSTRISTLTNMERIPGVIPIGKTGTAILFSGTVRLRATIAGSVKADVVSEEDANTTIE